MKNQNISVKVLSLNDITPNILGNIEVLLNKAYYNSNMYESFVEDMKQPHKYFKVFLAFENTVLLGIVVLEDKIHSGIDYFDYPPVHLKRCTVDPKYRSSGIGKILIASLKNYAFNECDLDVIFGQSNEVGAISFYLREGALFSSDDIGAYSIRNSYEENMSFFREFVTNKKFKGYRYPQGHGLGFVYVRGEKTKEYFQKQRFNNRNDLLSIH